MGFDEAVDLILSFERGYSFNPKDPGGETNFGISKKSYPSLDIKALTKDKAKELYKEDFWDKLKCDDLPPNVALILFDCAVNQGPSASVKMLQALLGCEPDGIMGPNTVMRAAHSEPKSLCVAFLAYRAVKYAASHDFSTFGRGWMARLFSLSGSMKWT